MELQKETFFHNIASLGIVIILTIPFMYSQMQTIQGLDRTSDIFTIVKSTPADLQFKLPRTINPEIVFSRPIGVSETNLSKYISITPPIKGIWRLDRTKRIVTFMSRDLTRDLFPELFKSNTLYSIVILKNLPSIDKKVLSEDISITFKTETTHKKTPSITH